MGAHKRIRSTRRRKKQIWLITVVKELMTGSPADRFLGASRSRRILDQEDAAAAQAGYLFFTGAQTPSSIPCTCTSQSRSAPETRGNVCDTRVYWKCTRTQCRLQHDGPSRTATTTNQTKLQPNHLSPSLVCARNYCRLVRIAGSRLDLPWVSPTTRRLPTCAKALCHLRTWICWLSKSAACHSTTVSVARWFSYVSTECTGSFS